MSKQRKIRLETDDLRVETFELAEAPLRLRGTVEGQNQPDTSTGDFISCPCDTRENTCFGSCAPSCQFSCPGRPGCDDNETVYLTCPESCGWVGGQAVLFPNC
jgi:hypothetical protein